MRNLITRRGQPTVVLAKSAGVALTALAASEGWMKPQAAVFCGTTLALATAEGKRFGELLRRINCDCTFVQQRADPLCSMSALTDQLKSLRREGWRVVEAPRDDHHYSDMATLETAIRSARTSCARLF